MNKHFIPGEEKRRRLDAMGRLFTKSDTVLAGSRVHVATTDSNVPAPSWTDGKTVTFNRTLIGDVATVEDVIRVMGLNYHELAHVLYTPRQRHAVVQAVISGGLHDAFNMLEDQRIETLLTAKYPATIPYLVSTFMRFCIMTPQAYESNFVLMYGRRYLPREVRQAFRDRFKQQELIPQFEAIIDQYRKLTFPSDNNLGIELLKQFDSLINQARMRGVRPEDPNGHTTGMRPDINAGSPESESQQKKISEMSDDLDEAFDEEDDENDIDDTEGSDDDGGSAGNGSDDDAEDSDSSEAEDGTGGDSPRRQRRRRHRI